MPATKVIPFIMEGSTDATSLLFQLNMLIGDNGELREKIISGDITLYRIDPQGYFNISGLSPMATIRRILTWVWMIIGCLWMTWPMSMRFWPIGACD